MTARAGDVHHIAIAVPSIAGALPFYRDILGLTVGETREVPDQQVRIAFLTAANTRVELVEPLGADTGVARFVAERGRPALHHLCFVVDDLRGTLDRLAARGVELVDRVPRRGAEGDVAFLHPRASDGVLVELIDRKSIR